MRLVLLAAAAVATLPVSVCAQPLRQDTGREMVLTEEHNGKEISISVTSTLILKLPAQLGTGYSWQVVDPPPAVLSPGDKPRVETTDTKGAGRQERQVFTFTPVKSGSAVLRLHYVRPWEKEAKPQKTYSVRVTVE
ncbi:MAG TPA: protease inhibitor I42 family protein [Vicinamibacterales bacterium]|nr:protease inhibitor I42 family protein [Vicinamibacterales bacterium]